MTNANTHRRMQPHQVRRSAFTLIEVLVVLGIIAILASISLVVANRVTESGRERLTSDIIKTLDTAAQSLISQRDKIPSTFTDAEGYEFPLIDARLSTSTDFSLASKPEPSLQLFFAVAKAASSVDEAVRGIDPKYIERASVHSTALNQDAKELAPGNASPQVMTLPVVKDSWGQPIRFVHPAYHGGYGDFFRRNDNDGSWQPGGARQPLSRKLKSGRTGDSTLTFRRAARPYAADPGNTLVGDADEGLCAGTMPYFYSAGPDKNPGTREDNVYTTKPTYPGESKPGN